MSSFYSRADEPENGDHATTERYGNVILIGRLSLTYVINETFWVVELDDGELKIVRESELENIGYYGE
jgi:hypothetical protein